MKGTTAYILSKTEIAMATLGVASITTSGNTITIKYNAGNTATLTVNPPKGDKGTSITKVEIDINNHLICTFDDNTTTDAGLLPSGGSGTTDYTDLTNKPSINGVELSGNKTLAQLGIDLSKYTTTDKAISKIELVDAIPTGSTGTTTEKCLRLTFADGTTVADVSVKDLNYDDTKIKADIKSLQNNKVDKVTGKSLIDDTEIARLALVDNYDDKAIKASIKTVSDGLMASAGYSPDYKKLDIITVGGTKKSIDLLPIISHAKLTELSDVDSTNQGNGKTLVYNSATGKHEYVDSSSTDELVKMDSTSTAKHLGDLIDKTTIVNDNGKLVAKTLDGLTTSITELNYIKGLQMPVQDLVTAFANGGLKTIDTPFPTYADLQSYDVSTLLDDIRYLVRVLVDETHDGKITAYLIKKGQTAPTFYGYLSDSRDFKTNPIDLVNEITGKLKAKNIDSDDLFALLTISDVYKTATAKDDIFGTYGAKAMYDELNTAIGKKANNTDLTTHTGDTDIHTSTTEKDTWNTVTDKASKSDLTTHTSNTGIHITTAERTKWNKVDNKVDKTNIIDNLTSTNTDKPLSANQGKVLKGEVDLKANKTEVVKKTDITTTINSASTASQVPSAKSVFDNIKKNGLIWQGKQQLQNSQESSVFNYCKSNFIAERICGFRLEIKDGSGYFGSASVTIIYCLSSVNYGWILGLSDKSGIPMAIIQITDGIKKWQKLCTTSVADVPVTNIAPADTTTFVNFAGNCNYCVKNGICYVTIWGVKITSTGASKQTGVYLPKSVNGKAGTIMVGVGDGTCHAFAYVLEDGNLFFDVKDANINLYASFSYPVMEG